MRDATVTHERKICPAFQVNSRREDFICTLPNGHGSSKPHQHKDGTRWRGTGEKRGHLRPTGMRKFSKAKTK